MPVWGSLSIPALKFFLKTEFHPWSCDRRAELGITFIPSKIQQCPQNYPAGTWLHLGVHTIYNQQKNWNTNKRSCWVDFQGTHLESMIRKNFFQGPNADTQTLGRGAEMWIWTVDKWISPHSKRICGVHSMLVIPLNNFRQGQRPKQLHVYFSCNSRNKKSVFKTTGERNVGFHYKSWIQLSLCWMSPEGLQTIIFILSLCGAGLIWFRRLLAIYVSLSLILVDEQLFQQEDFLWDWRCRIDVSWHIRLKFQNYPFSALTYFMNTLEENFSLCLAPQPLHILTNPTFFTQMSLERSLFEFFHVCASAPCHVYYSLSCLPSNPGLVIKPLSLPAAF